MLWALSRAQLASGRGWVRAGQLGDGCVGAAPTQPLLRKRGPCFPPALPPPVHHIQVNLAVTSTFQTLLRVPGVLLLPRLLQWLLWDPTVPPWWGEVLDRLLLVGPDHASPLVAV